MLALAPAQGRAAETNVKVQKTQGALVKERDEVSWSLFPGIYRSYNTDVRGAEVTLLYKGLGGCVGVEEGKLKYAEVEWAFWLLSLSTGPRFTEKDLNFQFTTAIPLLPIFPYARWTTEENHAAEFGFMAKVPLWTSEKEKAPVD